MKEIYSAPEFEIVRLSISSDVLSPSDPEPTIATDGSGANPDPFGGLGI